MATRIGQAAVRTARPACEVMAKKYGLKALPENIEARLKALADEKELVTAETTGARIVTALELQALGMMATGALAGPETPDSLEKQARAAESLAKMLEKKEDVVGARRQARRAAELRQRILALGTSHTAKDAKKKELRLVRTWTSKPTAMYPEGGITFEEWG